MPTVDELMREKETVEPDYFERSAFPSLETAPELRKRTSFGGLAEAEPPLLIQSAQQAVDAEQMFFSDHKFRTLKPETQTKIINAEYLHNNFSIPRTEALENQEAIIKGIYGEEATPDKARGYLKDYWVSGRIATTVGLYGSMLLLGEGDPEEVKKQIQYWQRQMPSADRIKRSIPVRMLAEFLNQMPMYLEGVRRGLPVALGSALTWGAVGLAMGGAPGPITAAAGFAVGMQAKVIETVMRLEGGLAYLELLDIGIEPEIAKPAALAVGVINGLLESLQISTILRAVGGKNFAKIGMKSVMIGLKENPAIKKIMARHAAEFAGELTFEVATEVMQEVTNVIMDEFSTYVHNRIKSEKLLHKWDEVLPRLKEIAVKSALGFVPMLLPGHIVRGGKESFSAIIDKTMKEIPETGMGKIETPKGPTIQVIKPAKPIQKKILPKEVPKEKVRISEVELSEGDKVKIDGADHEVLAVTKTGTIVENTQTKEKYVVPSYGDIDIDKSVPIREISKKEIHEYATILKNQALEDYKTSREADFITRVKQRVGKINVRFFKQAEELKGIPAKVKQAIFTKDINAMDIDEAAMAMGMSDVEFMDALKNPDVLQTKPPQAIRDYYAEAERELVEFYEMKGENPVIKQEDLSALEKTPYGQLKKIAKEDENLLQYAATYMRKFYNLGKREKAQAVKERASQAIRRKRAIQEINKRRKEAIKRIETVRKNTAKLPDPQKEQIEELIGGIDFVRHPAKKMAKIERICNELEKNYNPISLTDNQGDAVPQKMLDDLKLLEKKNGNEMTLGEIESLRDAVSKLYAEAKTKSKIKEGRKQRLFNQVLQESIEEMKPSKKVAENIINLNPGKLRGIKDVGKLIRNIMGIRSDHFDLIVETIAGINSVSDRVLSKGPEQGTNIQRRMTRHFYNMFQDELKRVGFKYKPHQIDNWLGKKFNYEFNGVKVNISRNQKLSFYIHWLNSDNRTAVIEGGFGSRAVDDKNLIYKFSEDPEEAAVIYSKFIEKMTVEEKQFVEAAILLTEETYQLKDKVFYAINGFHIPRVKGVYWHKGVMPIGRGLDYAREAGIEELKQTAAIGIGTFKSDLIARVGSKLPIYLNDFTYDLNALINHASAYIGLEIPLREASKLLNNKTYMTEIYTRYGAAVWKEVRKGLQDVAGQWKDFDSVEAMMMKLKDKATVASLTNPRVWLMQTLSYALIHTYVKPQYLTQGVIQSIFHPKELDARHRLLSAKYEERAEGYMSRDVADIFKRMSQRQIYGGRRTAKEAMMGPLRFFDLRTVRAGMQSAVLQALNEFKTGHLSRNMKLALNLTDEDIKVLSAEDKVRFSYEFAEWVMDRTQPMFNPTHRSALSRGKPLTQLFTMYSSFTNQELNLLRRTFREMRRYKDTDARAQFMRAAFSILVVNSLGAAAIRGIYDRLLRKKQRKVWVRIIESWASMFYFVRELIPVIISYVEKGPLFAYSMELPTARLAIYLTHFLGDAIRAAEGKKIDTEQWIINAWGIASYGWGLPFTPVPDTIHYISRSGKTKKMAGRKKKKI